MKATIKDGVIHSPYPDVHVPSCSLFALLEERMLRSGDNAAILSVSTKAVSHVELLQRFRSCAAGLQAFGLGRGDRVYTRFCSSSVDGLIALCAVIFTGATVTSIVGDFTQGRDLLLRLGYISKHLQAVTCSYASATSASFTTQLVASPFRTYFVPLIRSLPSSVIWIPDYIRAGGKPEWKPSSELMRTRTLRTMLTPPTTTMQTIRLWRQSWTTHSQNVPALPVRCHNITDAEETAIALTLALGYRQR
ncbi:hypothetical protein MRX96_054020, partial [Rhipicephalus microplus]